MIGIGLETIMQALQTQTVSESALVEGHVGRIAQFAPGLAFPCFTMRFSRNEEVFAEEEEADFVYQVISGAVREVRILSDGRRLIGAFHLPGDVFGLNCGEAHRCGAEAVADCEIALVRRSALNRMVETDGVAARRLWEFTARDLSRLQDHMLDLGRKSAVERVASFLIGMAARGPSPENLDLPMSRGDIGDYLGLTIETVSRTLTQLERDQAISMSGSRHIMLRERLFRIED
jgi:CRP/FNR family nitrogen fixation transcriptional regulator